MEEARRLHFSFYRTIPLLLRSNDRDDYRANAPYVKSICTTYLDCSIAFVRALRPEARLACVAIKHISSQMRKRTREHAKTKSEDEQVDIDFKDHDLRSHPLVHLVAVIDAHLCCGSRGASVHNSTLCSSTPCNSTATPCSSTLCSSTLCNSTIQYSLLQ